MCDEEAGDNLVARAALQLLVKPGSYKKDPPVHCAVSNDPIPPPFDSECIHWSTKEQGSLHVSALLVRMDLDDQ